MNLNYPQKISFHLASTKMTIMRGKYFLLPVRKVQLDALMGIYKQAR